MLGVCLMMAASASAQQEPKEKVGKHEYKYKSDDLKVKLQKDEDKYKAGSLKVKENSNERKVKSLVKPMRISKTEQTTIKTGETQVWTSRHEAPSATNEETTATKTSTVRKSGGRKYAARSTAHRRTAARKTSTARKYAAHTRKARHHRTYAASQQQRVTATQPQYIHDTVYVTRVDTVVRIQRMNTYSGYRVPRGDFKKVKLKRDKDGRVWMKRKE
jgi:hypothetical protein